MKIINYKNKYKKILFNKIISSIKSIIIPNKNNNYSNISNNNIPSISTHYNNLSKYANI